MLWRTHIRLANIVLDALGLSRSSVEADYLRKGSVEPDKWGDYPHHYGKSGSIIDYVIRARRFFLSGDLANAYFCLGVTLHYIQDSYTSLTSRSPNHEYWEQQIDESRLVGDLENLVAYAFRNREDLRAKYTYILSCISKPINGETETIGIAVLAEDRLLDFGRPEVDLNFAARVSQIVARSIFGSKTLPKLEELLDQALIQYVDILKKEETVFVDQTTDLIKKRDEARSKRKSSGIFQRIHSYFLTVQSGIFNYQAERRIGNYEKLTHLMRVVKQYEKLVRKMSAPYANWYSITIPKLDCRLAEKELLSLEDAYTYFEVHEDRLDVLVKTGRLPCYCLKGKKFFRKSELEKALAS